MTVRRDSPYLWVTWLSKPLAGDVQCIWASWFRAHYTSYKKAPSDFDLSQWISDHSRAVEQLAAQRRALGETVYKEDQNYFKIKLRMPRWDTPPG
jgi:hypothetical protein